MRGRKMMRHFAPAVLCAVVLFTALLCTACTSNSPNGNEASERSEAQETVSFAGEQVVIDPELEGSRFSDTDFTTDENTGRITCLSGNALTGVDVSSHQGEIDWAQTAQDGIDFAILRIGRRGYTEGGLSADSCFETNYSGCTQQGLQVGVYFFSQAVTPDEAEEEAEYVLSLLDGRELGLPIVFDWEMIEDEDARTQGIGYETVTACAKAFCDRVEQEGYRAAFYFNDVLGFLSYDFSVMQDYDAWYAEYSSWPAFIYRFDLWQYSSSGSVAGISGDVDMDLWFCE